MIYREAKFSKNRLFIDSVHLWRIGKYWYRIIKSLSSFFKGPGRINTGKIPEGEAELYKGMVFSDGMYQNAITLSFNPISVVFHATRK